MTKSKTLPIIIALCILCLAALSLGVSVNAFAAEETVTEVNKDNAPNAFTIANNVLTDFTVPAGVTGKIKVVIPADVTSIGARAFEGQDTDNAETDLAQALAEVVIPDSVTSIGDYAFTHCASLKTLVLPQKLVTIGAGAFNNTAITSLTIPASVEVINGNAFDSCTQLSALNFAVRGADAELTLRFGAFQNCTALTTVTLPANCTIANRAFLGCAALQWVYLGKETVFVNSNTIGSEAYFPRENTKIVFPDKAEYDKASDATFIAAHISQSTYVVNVNCYIGSNTQAQVYQRLHGYSFNFVLSKATNTWSEDTTYNDLPRQAAYYASTTWYGDKNLTTATTWEQVNALLNGNLSEINLYCYQTIVQPVMPQEPVSWVVNDELSYSATDIKEVLKAAGCTNIDGFSDEQLAAMNLAVVYADEQGNVAETPANINQVGAYSVSVTLNPKYGVWAAPSASTVTVNVDTKPFNIVLIVFLVLLVVAAAVTASTAIIRKKVQARAQKKKISQQEVLEKFRATGEETTLK